MPRTIGETEGPSALTRSGEGALWVARRSSGMGGETRWHSAPRLVRRGWWMARSVVSARRFVGRRVSRVCRRRVYRWFWAPVEQPLVDVLLPAGFEFTRGTEEDLPLLAQV